MQRVTRKDTYGLYQYRTISIHIWIISIQDYTNNERVKTSTIYHISADEKIQPLQYYYNHTGQEKHYLPISIAPHTTISHYHRMKGQRQIISSYFNQHENKIPPMKLYHHIKPLQYNRTLYYKIKEAFISTAKENLFMPSYLLSNAL